MEELHRLGGSPRGWRFRVPQGDPSEGRKVYLKLECFSCHAVQGEDFPAPDEEEKKKGPDLTGMGKHHSEEYLFESIVNPNRVIVEAPGYTGTDGLSIMPDYNHLLTIEEAVNLVAYVKSLKGKALHHGSDHGKGTHHKSK